MKTTQILIAGFGGQGILFAGKFLAYKGLLEDLQVSQYPPSLSLTALNQSISAGLIFLFIMGFRFLVYLIL